MKLFIISNRLPVKVTMKSQDELELERSEGGLATGLSSLDSKYEKHWIGWPGINPKKKVTEDVVKRMLAEYNYHPVFLTNTQYNNYYEGYSNSTLWPLCHYFYSYLQQKRKFWDAYREVNALFCEKVLQLVDDDSMVWVQDYQLMLLPQMLRVRKPNMRIGYFHHIPFPSYELLRVLLERKELLTGLLGADLVAFHTHDYMRHFINAVEHCLHKEFNINEIKIDDRAVHVEALPMGINYELYKKASASNDVKESIANVRQQLTDKKVILSVDRLDYSKGLLHRLVGFEIFLQQHPEYHGKVTLAMIVVPSRDKVEKYAEMKHKIDERISVINGKYAAIGWTPICYYYHSFPFNDLVAMYALADVALVTPLRDGMNLVAKEYVAVKQQQKGVLILSELAGAAVELSDAIIITPNATDEIANAIYTALEMPEEEQQRRMSLMQQIISEQTVGKWADDFMEEWLKVVRRNQMLHSKYLSDSVLGTVVNQYNKASKRLIMLDYDGTLVGFKNRAMDAYPTPEVLEVLTSLCSDPSNTVVINSGRDRANLDAWLGNIEGLKMAAEHGACYKDDNQWVDTVKSVDWDPNILKTIKTFVVKTPGSWLEKKTTSLAWHYREVDSWMGLLRSRQLAESLYPQCSADGLQILNGNKVIEIKPNEYSKGTELERMLANDNYNFVMVIGDDVTDESMFRSTPKFGISIKVGAMSNDAKLCISRQKDVIPFLTQLYNHK
ncbi:MAG: bifunctional alpha,alpha-trehalose-phosphate synthase (UDP-forming)/trehalose-phosphatase [Marinilabiliaceae bacterium]|nr:bifunctional alpha,alpha-trehalose-phosphate synthase (UDP-forming)/trehalose-phosphatase [Marinilabiliaceae bacterium]